MDKDKNQSNIIFYQTEDGRTKLEVRLEDETVWLSQKLMADLFQKDVRTINEHIRNVFEEGELNQAATIRKFRIVQKEGERDVTREVDFYNLDVVISVGYRVKSLRGTQFRIWATQRLKEYIVKGFTLDDERLKQGGQKARYFQELLQRIRDIRSSERNFYQKVTDIYATSIDYRKDDALTREFFATVQNKMHYAVHGHTAAEIISERANRRKPLMGLTSFKGSYITAHDVKIAKNYLTESELRQLNLIVSMYLDFAELQATNGRLMKMADWIAKLDDFLKLSERKLLKNAGSVSAEQAARKAEDEFEIFRKARDKNYISDFDRAVNALEQKAAKQGKKN
ncbi:MAG: virulence RhuM family protein [Kiritimatiellae bacterium]|jgi:hypothetical protein|nr:virulence RhuM family protein [Kiritimatiellia bacterium]